MSHSLKLLRTVLAFLEKLSPDDLKHLTEGRAELRLVPAPRRRKTSRQASKPLPEADLARLRAKIEKQKTEAKNQDLNWLNKYRKDDLWQLIRSYNFPPDILRVLTPSTPKVTLIVFIQIKILGLETNKGNISDIDLAVERA